MNLHDAKILVTGGGGFLGGAIVRQLRGLGAEVWSLARRHYPDLEKLGVRQLRGDIADPATVRQACRVADVVFHTAAKAGVWGPYSDFHRTNVTGTVNVIAACRKARVQALVHTSSPSVVFNGRNMRGIDETAPYPDRFEAPYPQTKALAERRVRAAAAEGLPAVILRPHLIWGPRDNHLVPRIVDRAKRLRIVGSGTNLVDTTYIDNAARAHLLAATRLLAGAPLGGRLYFISNGEPTNLWQMINRILAAAGKPPVSRVLSLTAARRLGTVLEFCYQLFHIKSEPPMTRFVAQELATDHWFDISAARRDLGYHPEISIAEGLRHLENWLKGQPPCT